MGSIIVFHMRVIQISVEPELLGEVDKEAHARGESRSALFREAVRRLLHERRIQELEDRDRRAYEVQPVQPGEFDVWDRVITWPED